LVVIFATLALIPVFVIEAEAKSNGASVILAVKGRGAPSWPPAWSGEMLPGPLIALIAVAPTNDESPAFARLSEVGVTGIEPVTSRV
jgi:hypothetical protein